MGNKIIRRATRILSDIGGTKLKKHIVFHKREVGEGGEYGSGFSILGLPEGI